ncbi:hypothetical protein CMT41_12290 [Colwellia sp. MT41]|uniref:YecA family protein n=1 Tax=Colwellia sp. MT41 TaxID=58049 RepID=UPI00071797DD|nr:SEC-C domain-containing protein [Colwellia sp. MT41]ALO35410.1 hypothetical protein CMT41_12290 [Colwellia sp. MT41]
MSKIGRNDPCWCGSGNKYKNCHLIRANEVSHSIRRIIAGFKEKTNHKECMHPEASKQNCSKKIINAHTIQKKGPLKFIVDDTNHVYSFGMDQYGRNEISKLGWQKASTFKGFCGKHDKELFSVIEDVPYNNGQDQNFIAGYRAYALEYFKKISMIKAVPFMRDNIDRGMTYEDQVVFQQNLHAMKLGFFKGIDDFKTSLDIFTGSYKLQQFDDFESVAIYFTGELNLVVSGCFTPEFTIEGEEIQSLDLDAVFVENIAINTLSTENGFAIVFSWPSQFTKCAIFIDSLLNIEHQLLPSRLVELIFSYIENSYFSMDWLNGLDNEKRVTIESMARKPVQYGESVEFTNNEYTNWQVTGVQRN